jgi:hypothetical protein
VEVWEKFRVAKVEQMGKVIGDFVLDTRDVLGEGCDVLAHAQAGVLLGYGGADRCCCGEARPHRWSCQLRSGGIRRQPWSGMAW